MHLLRKTFLFSVHGYGFILVDEPLLIGAAESEDTILFIPLNTPPHNRRSHQPWQESKFSELWQWSSFTTRFCRQVDQRSSSTMKNQHPEHVIGIPVSSSAYPVEGSGKGYFLEPPTRHQTPSPPGASLFFFLYRLANDVLRNRCSVY